MTNETHQKRQMFYLNVHCETAAGTVGDWTAVMASPEAAIIQVQRRLLDYFGKGILNKLPTLDELKVTQIPDASAETLKKFGLLTEKVTFAAQTFENVF